MDIKPDTHIRNKIEKVYVRQGGPQSGARTSLAGREKMERRRKAKSTCQVFKKKKHGE